MLSKLILTMSCEKDAKLSHQMGSVFQGVLMQHISSEYAAFLHSQNSNPYSQYVTPGGAGLDWVICATTRKACSEITDVLSDSSFRGFRLNQLDADFNITNRHIETISLKELTHRFYNERSERFFNLRFITPTAFKSNGRYVFFPEIRLIFRSLMSKYGLSVENSDETDEDMLSELTEKSSVVKYRLHSTYYSLEKLRIPAFAGELTIKVSGSQTLANYAHLLFRFGEYSGIGMKCAMGMGAIRLY